MTIDVNDLLERMVEAAKLVFDESWPDVKEHAETELKGVAEGIVLIERLRIDGKISQKQSRLLIRMKENTAKIVLLTLEGMGIVVVEKAINAALKVVKDTVNGVLDFRLI